MASDIASVEVFEQLLARREGQGRSTIRPILHGQESALRFRAWLHSGECRIFPDGAGRVHRPEARLQHFHRHIAELLAGGLRATPERCDKVAVGIGKAIKLPRRRDGGDGLRLGNRRNPQSKAAPQAIADEDGRVGERFQQRKQALRHMMLKVELRVLGTGAAPIDQIGVMSCCGHVAQHGSPFRQVQNLRRIDQRRDEDHRRTAIFRAVSQQSGASGCSKDGGRRWRRRPGGVLIFAQTLESCPSQIRVMLRFPP